MAASISSNAYPEIKIDLNPRQDEIKNFITSIDFKSSISLKNHFKKHKKDARLKHLSTKDEYLDLAKKNIINTIFKKGFLLKTSNPYKIAFFATIENDFPNFMTIISYEEGDPKLITFYSANHKTIGLAAQQFGGIALTYMAKFENGISEKGWEAYAGSLEFGTYVKFQPIELEKSPSEPLGKKIDILNSKHSFDLRTLV